MDTVSDSHLASNHIEQFDEFFASGMEESVSPFLKPASRSWGKHLSLKAAVAAAFFLLLSFLISFDSRQSSLASLLLLVTYFLAGVPALISAIEDVLSWEINIDVLMTLAAFCSFFIGSGWEGALLLVLFAFSGALEELVRTKAKGALSSLKKLAPTKAHVLKLDGVLVERSLRDIAKGEHIFIKAGEIIPLDGLVLSGSSSINLVHLTGENTPSSKYPGDLVPSGALNIEGSLTVEVTSTSHDSTLSKIIKLITEAQESKPTIQRWFDKLSSTYAKVIIFASILFVLTLPFFGIPFLGMEGSIYRSLTFLIAASPCALIIAVPIAYLSAISACARQGILLKGGMTLDALASCKTIALDKTGTLTSGELTCIGNHVIGAIVQEEAFKIAYGLERNTVHPMAKAIMNYAQEKNIPFLAIDHFRQVPGYGLEGSYQQEPIRMGTADFVSPLLSSDLKQKMEKQLHVFQQQGELVSILASSQFVCIFRFKDLVRPQMKKTLGYLKSLFNMQVVMLTGDHFSSASSIARDVGIDVFFTNLKPADKLEHISRLAEKAPLAMVGDGINDAPALARATVGISMGKQGSSTAIEASDIVLLQDNIELLHWLFAKAHQTVNIVKQNIVFASAAILLATLPALLGWIPLWLAVLLHEGGTIIVGFNALRLLRR